MPLLIFRNILKLSQNRMTKGHALFEKHDEMTH
jgi:hypothetical protein